MLGRTDGRGARHFASRAVPRIRGQGPALLSTRPHICVFYNPASGGRSAARTVEGFASDRAVEIRSVGDPGSLAERVRETARDFDVVAAAGGDGTVGGVAAGLHLARRDAAGRVPPLAVVPVGTGNDFARDLGVPRDPADALESARKALGAGRRRWVDLIACTSPRLPGERRYALNAVVGGLGGRVADLLTPALRRRWGRFAYLRAVLPELLRCRTHAVVLQVDRLRFEVEVLLVVVAGGRYAAGGVPFAANADPGDGRADVVAIGRPPAPRLPLTLLRLLRGRHGNSDEVLEVRGRRVKLEAGGDFWMNLDGETWTAGSAGFEVVPRALEVLSP
ncbi:MAG: diacylglycerol/lipid kinase family protein [Gemmatimonadota bacterium]